ncbi:MAG: YigZ family protein [Deltaproteobacteria bacterium]
MADAARYPILAAPAREEIEIDRSRFIGSLTHVESVEAARAFIDEVSAEYADATHNCWAYVVGPPGSSANIGMSDDGEPHNTAGRPMLNVLLHADVGDVVAVVTRYFGGTKLGRGGLVRAYGGAVQAALDAATRTERVAWSQHVLTFDYAAKQALEKHYPTFEVVVDEEIFGAQIQHRVRLPEPKVEAFLAAANDATRGQVVVEDA